MSIFFVVFLSPIGGVWLPIGYNHLRKDKNKFLNNISKSIKNASFGPFFSLFHQNSTLSSTLLRLQDPLAEGATITLAHPTNPQKKSCEAALPEGKAQLRSLQIGFSEP
ncbi:MAG: hypothetical protein IJ990_05855 [Alistipes sp.]|nr:hypothetical protein [Alistipes sp.]MBR7169843.1 hypothetical protein [Alistipes sp.]